MTKLTRIDKIEGTPGLTFYCGELPADDAVTALGHEPNGYFWEGVARYLAPGLVDHLDLDSEGGMFAAYGKRRYLKRLQVLIEPYLADRQLIAVLLREADAAGFQFDD